MGCFLTDSSLGRKLVMSVSGCFLVLFLLFHMSMNLVALADLCAGVGNGPFGLSYNGICEFLGTNWYALAGTLVLAAGVVVHIVYAFILTLQNRKARGNVRYAVTVKEEGVSWASKNMLVLGIIVALGLALHLCHFWAKMQLAELLGDHSPEGVAIIACTFSHWYNVVLYLIWFAAIWFHLTHGVWSMFQTVGWANDKWYCRLKCTANIIATLVCLGFAVVVVVFYVHSFCGCCGGCC